MSRGRDGYTYEDGYAYQRSGHPILRWKGNAVPHGTRAGDTVGLGSLGDPTLVLPRAGAPEPINCSTIPINSPLAGCGCGGACGKTAVGDIVETISGLSMPVKIAGAVGLYLLYKKFKKRR